MHDINAAFGAQDSVIDVTILDPRTGGKRKVGADDWVDYLHLGKFGDDWRIVNVLWDLR